MNKFDSREQLAMDRACGDHGKMIYGLVSYTSRKYGGDYQEMEDRRQIARMAFLHAKQTHNPALRDFESYAKYVVGRELFEHIRTKARRSKRAQVQTFTDCGEVDSDARYERGALVDLMLDVGEDARTILDLLFDPEPFWGPCRTVNVKCLVKFLRNKLQWDRPRVQQSLSEIEAALT